MRLTTIPVLVVAVLGLAAGGGGAYLLLRGPYLAGPPVDSGLVMPAAVACIAGLFALIWAGARLAGVGVRM